MKNGAGEIVVNSIDTDGVKGGFDIEMLEAIASRVNVPIIASGGAGALSHFADAVTKGHADAVLAASLFHFKELTIREVKEAMRKENIPVRL